MKYEEFIEKTCNKIVNVLNLEKKTVYRRDNKPYLTRYYIFRKRKNWQPSIYLHCFHMGDEDMELHNHPWKISGSLILAGRYLEEYRDRDYKVRTHIFSPGKINIIKDKFFHRVDLITPRVWTLFVSGPKTQSWGFWDRNTHEYIDWTEHERRNKSKTIEEHRDVHHFVEQELGLRPEGYLQ